MDKMSLYDYLSFILPGGLILAAIVYGFELAPQHAEPSASGLVLLTAFAFVIGHLNAAIANFIDPLAWGRWPGTRASSTAGVFGRHGLYDAAAQKEIEAFFKQKFPHGSDFQRRFNIAYTVLRQEQLDAAIQTMNQQIGFYRNTASATTVALVCLVLARLAGHDALPIAVWLPLGAVALVLLIRRYRRFWARFGDEVIRGAQAWDQRSK